MPDREKGIMFDRRERFRLAQSMYRELDEFITGSKPSIIATASKEWNDVFGYGKYVRQDLGRSLKVPQYAGFQKLSVSDRMERLEKFQEKCTDYSRGHQEPKTEAGVKRKKAVDRLFELSVMQSAALVDEHFNEMKKQGSEISPTQARIAHYANYSRNRLMLPQQKGARIRRFLRLLSAA